LLTKYVSLPFCAFFLHRPHCSIKIVERIAEHTTLKSVMARRSNITDTALQSLLAHCPNLTALDFSESHMVTNEGLLLLEPLAPQLRKLRMLGLPVADSFCELVLGRATSLTELCLSHCSYITDDGWAQLAACKGMELFQCFYSSLTGECLLRLVAHWPRLVRVLDVRGIRFASRDELAALRRVVPAKSQTGAANKLYKGGLHRPYSTDSLRTEVLVAPREGALVEEGDLRHLARAARQQHLLPLIALVRKSPPTLRRVSDSKNKNKMM
jgi:hypothetical protein